MTKIERDAVLEAWDFAVEMYESCAEIETSQRVHERHMEIFMDTFREIVSDGYDGNGLGIDFIMNKPALFYGQI